MEQFTLRKLAETLNLPNWAAMGIVLVPLLLVLSIAIAIATGDTPTERVQMIYQLALVIAGLIGLPLAIWRSWTAHKQAQTGQKQLEGLQRQIAIAEAGQEADRLQKGAELLQAEGMAVRTTGISILREIAGSATHRYQREALDVLGYFLESRTQEDRKAVEDFEKNSYAKYGPSAEPPSFPEDIRLIFSSLLALKRKGVSVTFGNIYIRELHINNYDFADSSMKYCSLDNCHLALQLQV
jgi:hypothetical protein